MKEGLKCAAVFIGTVIGAGFATGQEVAVYFNNSAPIVAVFAGLLLGAFCSFFMYVGIIIGDTDFNKFLLNKRSGVIRTITFICAFITFIAMFCGVETLFASLFDVRHVAIPTVIIAGVLSTKGLPSLKKINAIIVPLIFIFTAIIFIKNGVTEKAGNYNPLNAVGYAALNIMLAGAVMARLGKGASVKSVKVAGVASGICLAVMLYMITLCVNGRTGSLPTFEVAREVGLSGVSGALIFSAIFTTMVSAIELSADSFSGIVPDKRLGVLTITLACYPFTIFLSFEQVVKYLYPVVSIFGVILIIATVTKFALFKSRGADRQIISKK